MLSIIFINPQRSSAATRMSRASLYRWLQGTSPSLDKLAKLCCHYDIDITLNYAEHFSFIAKQLSRTKELNKLIDILDSSKLDSEDRKFLKEYYTNSIYKQNYEVTL